MTGWHVDDDELDDLGEWYARTPSAAELREAERRTSTMTVVYPSQPGRRVVVRPGAARTVEELDELAALDRLAEAWAEHLSDPEPTP